MFCQRQRFSAKKVSEKFRKNHRKTPALENLFNKAPTQGCNITKRTPCQLRYIARILTGKLSFSNVSSGNKMGTVARNGLILENVSLLVTNKPRVFYVKKRGNGHFQVVSAWNTRDVFVEKTQVKCSQATVYELLMLHYTNTFQKCVQALMKHLWWSFLGENS